MSRGRSALNCCANAVISRIPEVSGFYVPFCPGDQGTAIGAAVIGDASERKLPFQIKAHTPYLGPEYSLEDCIAVIEAAGIGFEKNSSSLQCYC